VAGSTRADSSEQVNVTFPAAGHYVIVVVGITTAAGGSVYDLSSWVVDDAAPDEGGLAVTGHPVAAMPGDPVTLPLEWSGVTAKGLYLGLVTYHASAQPTAADAGAWSIVELTKTADTPPATDVATGRPEPPVTPVGPREPDKVVTPAPPGKRVEPWLRAIRVSGRTLRLWLLDARGARVHVAIERGRRVVATSAARRAPARGAVTLRLSHALGRGRYTITVVVVRGGHRYVAHVRLRR
jgi:hypothetical protein